MEDVTTIILKDHQKDHVKKISKHLKSQFSFIDTSVTGSGKTHSSLYLAQQFQKSNNTKVMIVAPSYISLNNEDGWLVWANKYGIDVEISTTYHTLRGAKGKVSHPWLIPNPNNKKKWVASQEFIDLCEKGLFIIFDEFHHCKNKSITHFACAALIKAAYKYRKVSKVACLSHTPGDKPDHIPQILRMSGVITSEKLFNHIPFTSEYEWRNYGLGQLSKYCRKISKSKESNNRIEQAMVNINARKAKSLCKELFDEYVRNKITFAMKNSENPHNTSLINAFMETDDKSLEIIEQGLNILKRGVGWNGNDVDDQKNWSFGSITVGLKKIEQGKLLCMANYVMKESAKHPNKKFVLSCGARGIRNHELLKNIMYKTYVPDEIKKTLYELKKTNFNWAKMYKDMMNYILSFLECRNKPDILNGTIKKKDRTKTIDKFQNDTNDSWCLIMSPNIGSESISLHDKYGNRPREMLIIPDYYFGRTVQSAGRINRINVKSDVKVMMVYSKEANLETNILTSMIKKTKVARDILAKNQKVKFPGEYEYWIQGKKDKELEKELKELKDNIE